MVTRVRPIRATWNAAAASIGLLALAACDLPVRQPVVLGYRNPTVPLAATARFSEDRFTGHWGTVACIGSCARWERYAELTDGIFTRETPTGSRAYLVSPPGVLRDMGGRERLVVMWVDEGFRTAAIGEANGSWAAIIDRSNVTSDRLKAATEILDFNGWDIRQLKRVAP